MEHTGAEAGAPLLREVFPSLTAELVSLLEQEDEPDLAVVARDLRILADCGCGDDFCQSIRTAPHPRGTPYGPDYRCVPLPADDGYLVLDVVGGRIVYVEVLYRPEFRRASPGGGGRAEAVVREA
ncbi:hypothetical protein [Streptomyces sp. NPDC056492]|uniref:hypothetical protein n=1 Tax=unclassified Streptomyces TaxID=2593676 RepID=UPI0036895F35